MKTWSRLVLLASAIGMVCLAQARSDRWTVREEQTIRKTLNLSGEPMRVVVDNFDGYVHVTGTNGSQVRVVAQERIRAETPTDLNEAKRDVTLDMTEQPGSVQIEYKAPWRCNGHCKGCCDDHKRFYEVTYDIDVEVPRHARAVVSTVNGPLTVDQVDGDFDVHAVNGVVRMSGIGGSGDVHTVNGGITLHFAKNPSEPCSIRTVNGAIETHFVRGLSADLLFKTFNGQVYANFDVAPLPLPAGETERKNGVYVYRSDRRMAGRAGRGGPQISFETLNGGIRLYEE
jgi:hypothetical protein